MQILLENMDNGYTAAYFGSRSAYRIEHKYDVRLFLSDKVHHRAAYGTDEPEISELDRYKHKINRPAEIDATGYKNADFKYRNISELYY